MSRRSYKPKKVSTLKQLLCSHSFKYWGPETRVVNKICSEHHDLTCEKCGKFITIRNLSGKAFNK